MIDTNLYFVLTMTKGISNIERPDGTSNQFLRILRTIEYNGSVCAHSFKLQEVAFAVLWLGNEGLLVNSTDM